MSSSTVAKVRRAVPAATAARRGGPTTRRSAELAKKTASSSNSTASASASASAAGSNDVPPFTQRSVASYSPSTASSTTVSEFLEGDISSIGSGPPATPPRAASQSTRASTCARRPNNNENLTIVSPSPTNKQSKVVIKDIRDLARASQDRVADLTNYQPDVGGSDNQDDDDDESTTSRSSDSNEDVGPIFRSWVRRSTPTEDLVKGMTNFTIPEFRTLWHDVQHVINMNWNSGSGRRSNIHPMDALLMCVTQLKQGTSFKYTAQVFGMRPDQFRRLIENIVSKCLDDIYINYLAEETMTDHRRKGVIFEAIPEVLEAIDVTFQHSYARGEDYHAKKNRFSGKHKGYGWKTEVAVGPDGRARYASEPFPGSVHDMRMFKINLPDHLSRLEKTHGEIGEIDDLTTDDPDEHQMWAAVMDKGYEGARRHGRFLTPKKSTARRVLDNDDKRRNKKIESTRVIVENYFGRLKTLWGLMEQTYRLCDAMYGPYVKMCVGLTNYHVTLMPLRKEDGVVEANYRQRLIDQWKRATKKRKRQQEQSRATTRARRSATTETIESDGDVADLTDNHDEEGDNTDEENS